ncbi:MAG: signal peptidase I [Lentisphaerae bacterium]|nr:signal peptidase I [Lentisphaerota bacterium]MBQ4329560.1 signal peptidase I [Lentisphaeria bacterium]
MEKNRISGVLRNFFLPEINKRLLLRIIFLAVAVYVLFSVFQPSFISGSSMEPSWKDGGFTFSFRLRYLFSPPARGDVVTIGYFGRKMLLKRVVAVAGDTVEFREGKLLVNGAVQYESYVILPCKWNTPPVTVREGYCYVVGDNRSMSSREHKFGEVELNRITGGPLF